MTINKILEEDIRNFAESFALADELRGMHIAITGATGLLGSCMTRCLLSLSTQRDLGIHVTCIVRNAAKAHEMFGDDVTIVEYDFSSGAPLLLPADTDSVIHFASPTASKFFVDNPVETMNTGLLGTMQLLKAAKSTGCKVVFVSSLEVYGAIYDDSKPVDEHDMGYLDPLEVRSSYPMAKRAAECLCKSYAAEYGVQAITARLAQTFGAGVTKDDNRVFAQFARSIIASHDIILHTTGELSRCYCYTTDAIEGILYILQRGTAGEAYNVSNDSTYISVADMARRLCETFNPGVKPVVQLQDGLGYSPVTKLRLSSARLQALGWKPHYDLMQMFGRLIASFKS